MILPGKKGILEHGKPIPEGVYDGLIENPKTSFWDADGFIAKRRRTERKTWIYFGAFCQDIYCGIAIADAGFAATAFSYFYIPSENLFVEDKITIPFGFGEKFDPALYDDWKLGRFSIASNGEDMHIQSGGKFELDIRCKNNNHGLSFVCPSKGRPFNFTYKNLCLDTELDIQYKGKSYKASGKIGGIDFSKGYPPRQTTWNWASVTGLTGSGKGLGINLVDGYNGNLENAAWIGDTRLLLSKADFSMEKPLDKNPWNIETTDGILKMVFHPKGARSENLNLAVLKSLFTQPYGHFEGTIICDGVTESFTGYGVVEDHLAVW